MPFAPQLRPRGRAYVTAVIVLGAAVIAVSVAELYESPQGFLFDWIILAALTAVSGSATVKLPSIPASLSVSETFVFTSVLLFGAPAGTITVALDGLIISLWLRKKRKDVHRVLFNMAAPAISIWVASQVFFLLSGMPPLAYGAQEVRVHDFLGPLLVFTVLFFALNSSLIACAVALETSESPVVIWRQNFMWLSLNFFCGASVAALLAVSVNPQHVDLTYLGAILPLLFVLYMTYRTSMARVEDANAHLQRVNKLYLATIETLAHAIDAKDQVTHGHIRRVQYSTTRLARELGVTDESELKAIEASALLHDMGKLAIPEHILNKPGRLTPAEFDRMKLHASIGAEILSSIEFPYPVVPIVRHHHENWDGTGYPDGISGVDIPIGARILSVVDCYDALTSDRPYRPALSRQEAIEILCERRGSMYDPLVVDTFIRLSTELPLEGSEQDHRWQSVLPLSDRPKLPIAAELQLPHEWRQGLKFLEEVARNTTQSVDPELIQRLLAHLAQVVAFSDSALFLYDPDSDDLMVAWAEGSRLAESLLGGRLAVGSGLSGWVAANRQPILNSNGVLDVLALGQEASVAATALSVPLQQEGSLLGALAIYSDEEVQYGALELAAVMELAPVLAKMLASAKWLSDDELAPEELANLDAVLSRLRRRITRNGASVIVVSVRENGPRALTWGQLARACLKPILQPSDVILSLGPSLLCVIATSGPAHADQIVDEMGSALAQYAAQIRTLNWPREGRTALELLRAAGLSPRRSVA